MKITGRCDFCKRSGSWESGIYKSKDEAENRPDEWGGIYPNEPIPSDITIDDEEYMEVNEIVTYFACPNCARKSKGDNNNNMVDKKAEQVRLGDVWIKTDNGILTSFLVIVGINYETNEVIVREDGNFSMRMIHFSDLIDEYKLEQGWITQV